MRFLMSSLLTFMSFNVFAAEEYKYEFACVVHDELYDANFDMKVAFTVNTENNKCTILVASLNLPCQRKEVQGADGYSSVVYEYVRPLTEGTSKFILTRGTEASKAIWGMYDPNPKYQRAEPFSCNKL